MKMRDILRVGMVETIEFKVPREKTVPFLYPESPEFQAIPEVFATGIWWA
jgi:fluoroacetyl-CoA thioesterase